MQLKEVMNRDAKFVTPDSTLRQAARIMSDHDLRMLPVCRADEIIGILTLRDLTMRATAQGCDPARSKVGEVMTRDVPCCFEHQDIRQAAGIMRGRQIPMLIVIDLKNRLVGTVSHDDLRLEGRRPRLRGTGAGKPKRTETRKTRRSSKCCTGQRYS